MCLILLTKIIITMKKIFKKIFDLKEKKIILCMFLH